MRFFSAMLLVGAASAQSQPDEPAFVMFRDHACDHSSYEEGVEYSTVATIKTVQNCMSACERADRCTGFEVSPSGCVLWHDGACGSENLLLEAEAVSTFISSAALADSGVDATTVATTTTAATETTVEAVAVTQDLYALKYPQQACQWADYVEDLDWVMFSTTSSDAVECASACYKNDQCTGFEVGSDSGDSFGNGPYCAFWLNGACSSPTESYFGAYSITTGDAIDVDTYTLTEPLDAFTEYEAYACPWAEYIEGEDWEFAAKDSSDADACAKLCLDAADAGCTGFEIGSSSSTVYGDISSGYCAFWYNNSCSSPHEMYSARGEASTYVLLGSSGCGGYTQSHFFYVALLVAGLMACLGICCCCRRAMIRRRLQLRRQELARRTRTATRAAPGTEAVAAVTVAGGSRAVVYAVQVADEQEEPAKV